MAWLTNLRISGKLIAMILIPMLGVFYFSVSAIVDRAESLSAMNRLQKLTAFAVSANNVIHELQKERALTTTNFNKNTGKTSGDLAAQRTETDLRASQLREARRVLGDETGAGDLAIDLKNAMDLLGILPDKRRHADASSETETVILNYYKDTIDAQFQVLTNLNRQSTDAEVARMMSAYINYSKSKIASSRERAILYSVFAKQEITRTDLNNALLMRSERDNYFDVFQSLATPEALSYYRSVVKGMPVSETERIYSLAVSSEPGSKITVDPDYWYNMATSYIDLLKEAESGYAKELSDKIGAIQMGAKRALVFVITLNVLIVLVSLAFIWLVTRLMVRQLNGLKKSTELILLGETAVQAEVISRDEIGQLAEAFNQMAGSFQAVIAQADRISQGDYQQTIVPRSERDRLSIALTQMLQSLVETKAENERQYWLKTQLARITGISQGVDHIQRLAAMLASEIAGLVGAGQSVIYVRESGRASGEEPMYALLGSYAYKERKHVASRFRAGEGLVGQCALEGKPIMLTDVPDDYIRISSGLGERQPTTILVIPILFEDRAIAVLELASFRGFSSVEHDLLEQLSSMLGVVFQSVIGRQRTEELLREAQTLAEELQAQQEELRTANEELEEQTRMLKQSEEKQRIQSEELQVINEELEEKTYHLELQKADIEQQNRFIQLSKQELEVKARELELASQYKSEFLANMSHELRTPLNSLLILAKSLSRNEEGNLSEEQVESANVIYSGGLDLLTLINDILDLSKVEAGKLDVHAEEVSVASIIRSVHHQFRHVAKDKGLSLKLLVDDDVPETLVTDGQRMEQILKNLLSNAFKFTHAGMVSLRIFVPGPETVFHSPELVPGGVIAFAASDTGIGIPQDKQQAIFEAFQQGDGSTSRKYGGTGLGLTISRELAKLLGGELRMHSREGEGSTFTLYLPLRAAAMAEENGAAGTGEWLPPTEAVFAGMREAASSAEPAHEEATDSAAQAPFIDDDRELLTGTRGEKVILVIEDDPSFAKVLMHMARKKGFRCLAAGDGASGMALARQYAPSAILLDLGLPDISGLKVLDELKRQDETRHMPVHIISGREESGASLRKGAIGFLAKPIRSEDIDAVFARIESILDQRVKQVLVIEDDTQNQRAIQELLKNKKVEIHSAYSGREALEQLESQAFDCVILDLTLPDMSGFELLQKLAAEKAGEAPPVIINTGKDLSQAEYRELNRFTDSIVIKGANSPERLLDEVSLFLHSVHKSLPSRQREPLRQAHDSEEALKGRKILLVDDDLRNTFALSKVLRQHGLDVVMADNGQLALEKLEREDGIELVIMDIMMPVMDGFEAMRLIREQPKHQDLPIIALTAKAMTGDREKCIEGGANDYMTKPVDTDKLLSLIRVWLRH